MYTETIDDSQKRLDDEEHWKYLTKAPLLSLSIKVVHAAKQFRIGQEDAKDDNYCHDLRDQRAVVWRFALIVIGPSGSLSRLGIILVAFSGSGLLRLLLLLSENVVVISKGDGVDDRNDTERCKRKPAPIRQGWKWGEDHKFDIRIALDIVAEHGGEGE